MPSKSFILSKDEIPKQWYNILADIKMNPPLGPDGQPVAPLLNTQGIKFRETQAIVVTTLGTGRDAQIIDAIEGERKEPFMLHYNFPPYCVGETGFIGSPKRREIGHGKLARRGIQAVMPDLDDFGYVIRVVSEITESNGSSSMAAVCGTSLSLMDAGVPIKAPVAGVAMGLIMEGEKYAVLTDILGSWELRPGTVAYVGYGSLVERQQWDGRDWQKGVGPYTTSQRGLFFKVSYIHGF